MLLIVAPISSAAQIDFSLIDSVNTAVSELDYLHFKTQYYSKSYTTDDTTIIDAETWVYKTKDDTILGMHIRSIGHLDYGHIETIHRGSDSWIIKHDVDTIEKYDQTKGHWDGFSGNWKGDWTNEIPLITGINLEPEDSVEIILLENGNWIIHHVADELPEYSIINIEDWLYIDRDSYLPYRAIVSWQLEGRQNYSDLHIELLDTTANSIVEELYKDFPDYPIIDHSPPNPDLFKPLDIGAKAPKMEGYFVQNGEQFELSKHLKGNLVMIDFWYQTCGPCIRAIPYLDSLSMEYQDRGFKLFEVNSRDHNTSKEDLIEFVKKRGGNPDQIVMIDIETERKIWNCYANPTFYLIKDNKIVWVQQGFAPELMSEFRAQIEKHMR